MPDIDIVALGEPLVELNQTRAGEPQYQQGFGGDTSNAVIAAARQALRLPDAGGRGQLRRPAAGTVEGRGRGHVRRGSGPGRPYRSVLRAARPAGPFLQLPAARFRRQPHDAGQSQGQLIERARYLHVSGISLAISTSACDTVFAAIERAHAAGVQVSLDSNLRLRLWPVDRARAILREALRQADLFLPSMDDMQHLTGNDDPERTLDWIRDAGATGVVVLKLGKDGSIIDDGHGRKPVAALVEAVDATGAGDCFAGSLLARRCKGDSWEDAVRYANVAAALSTLGYGAVEPAQRGAGPGETVGSALDLGSLGPVGVFSDFRLKCQVIRIFRQPVVRW